MYIDSTIQAEFGWRACMCPYVHQTNEILRTAKLNNITPMHCTHMD